MCRVWWPEEQGRPWSEERSEQTVVLSIPGPRRMQNLKEMKAHRFPPGRTPWSGRPALRPPHSGRSLLWVSVLLLLSSPLPVQRQPEVGERVLGPPSSTGRPADTPSRAQGGLRCPSPGKLWPAPAGCRALRWVLGTG